MEGKIASWKSLPLIPSSSQIYNLSNLLLKFLVLFINFLYLCFFIFSFLCLLTLIALQIPATPLFFPVASSHCCCRMRIRSRNGCCHFGRFCSSVYSILVVVLLASGSKFRGSANGAGSRRRRARRSERGSLWV